MDIASFVDATAPAYDVTMVHKFPDKFAHSFNSQGGCLPLSQTGSAFHKY